MKMESVDKQFCNIHTKLKYSEDMFNQGIVKEMFVCLRGMVDEAEHLFDGQKLREAKEVLWNCQHISEKIEQEINHVKFASEDQRNIFAANVDETTKLMQINNQLAVLEKEIVAECRRVKSELDDRMSSEKERFLYNFEVDVEITYHLSEDDPAYDEDDDCMLAIDIIFGIPDEEDEKINWNDRRGCHVGGQHHCHLFHSLYDHVRPQLSLSDIFRIDTVWVNIKILHKKKFKVVQHENNR